MLIYHDTAEQKFYAEADGAQVGYIAYETDGDGNLCALATHVDGAWGGQGIAGRLLDALVQYATRSGVKVIPVCSYVAGAFAKHPEKYREVSVEK